MVFMSSEGIAGGARECRSDEVSKHNTGGHAWYVRVSVVHVDGSDGDVFGRAPRYDAVTSLVERRVKLVMRPQEVVVSACSSAASTSTDSSRPASTPSLHVHDLLTSAHLQAFKNSASSLNSIPYVPTQHGAGGTILVVPEGKALVNVWAWQKVRPDK